MKRTVSVILAVAICFGLAFTAYAANPDETVTVDLSKEYQTIDGFGASYTWYLGWAVGHNQSETIWDWVFNETEFNILRFRDLNSIVNADEALMPEKGYPEYYAVYKAAIDRGIDPTVLVTSWGEYDRGLDWVVYVEDDPGSKAPYFTLAKGSDGEYRYDLLADFCVQSVRYFFDAGIPVDYFSISNEIELQDDRMDEKGNARDAAGFFFGEEETDYHCCYWKAHIAVYNAFKEAFGEYAPKLLGAETMAGYEDLLHRYLDKVIEECPESLEVIGHHLYGTDLSENNLRKVGNFSNDYRLWMTEWYDNNFFEHAEVMMDELVYENVSAYIYWNGVWCADLGNCIIEVGADPNSEIKRMGNHYIMEHYSKFIKKGYKRVDVSDSLGTKFAAFKSPDESKLVLIAMNPTEKTEFMTLESGKEILGSRVWLSTEGENRFANKYMQDKGEYEDELEIPPRCLMTIELDLPADPNYVAPAIEKKVNPYVKTPGSGINLWLIVGIVIAVCLASVAIAAAVVVKNIKKAAKAENTADKDA